jgi:hypothetical protein
VKREMSGSTSYLHTTLLFAQRTHEGRRLSHCFVIRPNHPDTCSKQLTRLCFLLLTCNTSDPNLSPLSLWCGGFALLTQSWTQVTGLQTGPGKIEEVASVAMVSAYFVLQTWLSKQFQPLKMHVLHDAHVTITRNVLQNTFVFRRMSISSCDQPSLTKDPRSYSNVHVHVKGRKPVHRQLNCVHEAQ